jgi:DnaJ-class molecular chaperone
MTCKRCNGEGKIWYGNTTVWRGGIGGSMMTEGTCNKCWGSGDESNPGENLKLKSKP